MKIISRTKTWFTISALFIATSIFAFSAFGFNFGLDFTGGTLLEIKFEEVVEKAELASTLAELSQEKAETLKLVKKVKRASPTLKSEEVKIDLGKPVILTTEDGFIIRLRHIDEVAHETILQKLKDKFGNFEEIRFTTIGPTIGSTLKRKALVAIIITLIAIVLYIAFVFRKIPKRISPWKFSFCAIAALAHDTIITIGVYVLLGKFFGAEIDGLFVTALLAMLGFSVNDTIVIFDRIRENLKHQKRDETFGDVADLSLNQTMTRSVNTSVTTFITLAAIAILGSASLRFFILALITGVVVGTYSSVFVAAPLLTLWQGRRRTG